MRRGIERGALSQMPLVKYRQEIEITIAAGASSGTGTISQTVNTNKTALFYCGIRKEGATENINPNTDTPTVTLTNGTTVTATTLAAHATIARIIVVEVVEFWPWAIKGNIQYGTVTAAAATTATATLGTALTNTNNAFVSYLGVKRDQTTYNMIRDQVGLTLSATQVTLTRGNTTAGDNITASFCVGEFQPGILKSRQAVTASQVVSTATGTVTISSVSVANTMLVYGGWRMSTLGVQDGRCHPKVTLTDSTTITCDIGSAQSSVSNVPLTVLEFQDKYIKSRQYINNDIAGGASESDEAITAVVLAKTVANYLGHTMSANVADNRLLVTLKVSSTTNSKCTGGGTPAATVRTGGHQILEVA